MEAAGGRGDEAAHQLGIALRRPFLRAEQVAVIRRGTDVGHPPGNQLFLGDAARQHVPAPVAAKQRIQAGSDEVIGRQLVSGRTDSDDLERVAAIDGDQVTDHRLPPRRQAEADSASLEVTGPGDARAADRLDRFQSGLADGGDADQRLALFPADQQPVGRKYRKVDLVAAQMGQSVASAVIVRGQLHLKARVPVPSPVPGHVEAGCVWPGVDVVEHHPDGRHDLPPAGPAGPGLMPDTTRSNEAAGRVRSK